MPGRPPSARTAARRHDGTARGYRSVPIGRSRVDKWGCTGTRPPRLRNCLPCGMPRLISSSADRPNRVCASLTGGRGRWASPASPLPPSRPTPAASGDVHGGGHAPSPATSGVVRSRQAVSGGPTWARSQWSSNQRTAMWPDRRLASTFLARFIFELLRSVPRNRVAGNQEANPGCGMCGVRDPGLETLRKDSLAPAASGRDGARQACGVPSGSIGPSKVACGVAGGEHR